VLALQYFLIKGQDEARARDRQLDFTSGLEAGQPRMNWDDAVESNGGSVGVGGIIAGLTASELGMRAMNPHAGTNAMLYSGKDNSATSSYAYTKAFAVSDTFVTSTTRLSYWIHPQSNSTSWGMATGNNSSCVSVDLIFRDVANGSESNLRNSKARDAQGHSMNPAQQCGTLTLDAWNYVSVPLGEVASGKQIVQLDIGYDQPGNTGGYRGFIDDIRISR
jgi:hypothetical protein